MFTLPRAFAVPPASKQFHYSAYWRAWSRILSEKDGERVEVNLTPIPGCYSDGWGKVAEIWIRRHRTLDAVRDIRAMVLPIDTQNDMVNNLGGEMTELLLTSNILPHIDWAKYRALSNGGAPLHLISL